MKTLTFIGLLELPLGDSSRKQKSNGEMSEIPVTYLCWNCGNSLTTYEETDVPIPAKTVWNICPDCTKKVRQFSRLKSRRETIK
jgi:DNA-directed RNA polymerase subunit RPC12/RpoP